jgi:MFS family permease
MRKPSPLLTIILFGNFWTKAASMLSLPFLAIYLSTHTALSAGWIGFVVGCQPFAACMAGFWGGYLSDHFGRQKILLLSLAASSLVYFGFFWVAALPFLTLYKIIFFSILNLANGLFASFFPPVSQALISDNCMTVEEKTKFLHARYMAANIGAAIGPVAGAYAGISAGNKAFFLTSILYTLYTLFTYIVIKKHTVNNTASTHRPGLAESISVVLKDKKFSLLILASILFSMAYSQISSNLSLVIEHSFVNGVVFFSWMCALNGISVVVMQPIFYFLTKELEPKKTIFLGNAIFAVTCFIIVFFAISKLSIVLFFLLITIGEVLVVPTQSVLTDLFAPEEKRGLYFGASTLRNLGNSFGPIIGGLSLQFFGNSAVFILMGLLTVLSALLNKNSISRITHENQ